jgi:hypothetical protein
MQFSRKKIRGHKRKLEQLENWKHFVVSYPFDELKTTGKIFRMQLPPFVWHGNLNPNPTFHRHLYAALAIILKDLQQNDSIKKNEWTVQLWLFYPQTVRSLIIVAPKKLYTERNDLINAVTTKRKPPKLFGQFFNNFSLKVGADNAFELNKSGKNLECQTHKLGEIWTVE